MSKFINKITSLIEVKKIIALLVISVFCALSAKEVVSTEQFTTVAIMIVSFYFGQSIANEINHFIHCVQTGEPCRNPAEDGVEMMKILDAVYESAATGHEVILK